MGQVSIWDSHVQHIQLKCKPLWHDVLIVHATQLDYWFVYCLLKGMEAPRISNHETENKLRCCLIPTCSHFPLLSQLTDEYEHTSSLSGPQLCDITFNTLPIITQPLPQNILYNYHRKYKTGITHTTEAAIIDLTWTNFRSLMEGEFSDKLNIERGDWPTSATAHLLTDQWENESIHDLWQVCIGCFNVSHDRWG